MKDVWILEDNEMYRGELERVVSSFGFRPISFGARNVFLRSYFESGKENVAGMILDNMVPVFDEAGCFPEKNIGVGVIDELERKGLLGGLNVALYTSDNMNSEIARVCDMGVSYHCKRNGNDWVGEFLDFEKA